MAVQNYQLRPINRAIWRCASLYRHLKQSLDNNDSGLNYRATQNKNRFSRWQGHLMFSGIGSKITAVLAIVSAALLIAVKTLWTSNKKKADVIKGHEKKDEIIDDMRLAEVQGEVNENESLKDTSDSNWRNNI